MALLQRCCKHKAGVSKSGQRCFYGRFTQTCADSNPCARLCHGGAGICYHGLADVLVISGDVDLGLHAWRAASAFPKGETSKLASNRIAAVTFLLPLHRGKSAKYKTRYEDITLKCVDCAEIHNPTCVGLMRKNTSIFHNTGIFESVS